MNRLLNWLDGLKPTPEGLVLLTVREVVGFTVAAVAVGTALGAWLA